MKSHSAVEAEELKGGGGWAPPSKGGKKDYVITIADCVAKTTSTDREALNFQFEITQPAEHAGKIFFETILTDGEGDGAKFAKGKLEGLGIRTDVDRPNEEIAAEVVGRTDIYAALGVDDLMDKDANDRYTVPQMVENDKGQLVRRKKNTLLSASWNGQGGTALQAPQQQAYQPPPAAPPPQFGPPSGHPNGGPPVPPTGWKPPGAGQPPPAPPPRKK